MSSPMRAISGSDGISRGTAAPWLADGDDCRETIRRRQEAGEFCMLRPLGAVFGHTLRGEPAKKGRRMNISSASLVAAVLLVDAMLGTVRAEVADTLYVGGDILKIGRAHV